MNFGTRLRRTRRTVSPSNFLVYSRFAGERLRVHLFPPSPFSRHRTRRRSPMEITSRWLEWILNVVRVASRMWNFLDKRARMFFVYRVTPMSPVIMGTVSLTLNVHYRITIATDWFIYRVYKVHTLATLHLTIVRQNPRGANLPQKSTKSTPRFFAHPRGILSTRLSRNLRDPDRASRRAYDCITHKVTPINRP